MSDRELSDRNHPFVAARDWRAALAVAVVAGDTTIGGIARYNGLHTADGAEVLVHATAHGLIDEHGVLDTATRRLLAAEVSADRAAEVHAAAARHLFAGGPRPRRRLAPPPRRTRRPRRPWRSVEPVDRRLPSRP